MQALSAGSYVGGLGMLTPRLVRPQMAGRTGANVRGSVLDSYLGRGVRDTAMVRMGHLGTGINACTDDGWQAGFAVTASLMDTIGAAINAAAGTGEDRDRTAAAGGTALVGGADALAAGYAAACAASPGTGATVPSVGSPTNAEITALLSATREELAASRISATEADAARARAAAESSQRTQQDLMIGGGLAVAALVAVLVLRK